MNAPTWSYELLPAPSDRVRVQFMRNGREYGKPSAPLRPATAERWAEARCERLAQGVAS